MGDVAVAGARGKRRADEDDGATTAPTQNSTAKTGAAGGQKAGATTTTILIRPIWSTSTRALIDDGIASAARLQQQQQQGAVPVGIADVSLFTDDALEREISVLRARTEGRVGKMADAERETLGRLENEQLRRATPTMVAADSIKTKGELERVIKTEEQFLGRFGGRLANCVREEHARYAAGLRARLDLIEMNENACGNARPTPVSPHLLPGGAQSIAVSVDDIIAAASAASGAKLSAQDEKTLREALTQWQRTECFVTKQDPLRFAPAGKYHEATNTPSTNGDERARLVLEMIEAMRSSPLAAAAFMRSVLAHESVGETHARVVAATNVGNVAMSLPLGHPRPTSPKTGGASNQAREVDGAARTVVDEALGRGNAQESRFRGVDNSAWVKDPSLRTYGPYRQNSGGQKRSVAEACAIYEQRTGRKIPSWVKIFENAKQKDNPAASYTFEKNGKLTDPFTKDHIENGVTVNVYPGVFESDESIVAHLTHELYELEGLHDRLAAGEELTKADMLALTNPRRGENLHGKAWNIADVEVLLMRSPAGSAEHARLVKARDFIIKQRSGEPVDAREFFSNGPK